MGCTYCRGYEARNLDLNNLARTRYNRGWKELNAQEQVGILRAGLRAPLFLIDPYWPYFKFWNTVMVLALAFTAIVTPYEVAFVKTTAWDGLWIINRLVEIIFWKDMVMCFFTKVKVRSKPPKEFEYIKNHREIAVRYLKSWFFIDLLSVFPFYAMNTPAGTNLSDPSLAEKLQILRLLRLLRILKFVRLLQTSRIADVIRHHVRLNRVAGRLLSFFSLLIFVSHWMACMWGFTGLYLGRNLRYPCVGSEPEWIGDNPKGISWITTYYLYGNPDTPDSPCRHAHLYATSLHWALMTITSTGYGDIVATRFEEFIVEAVLMGIGSMVWAYIIGSACGVMANVDPYRVQHEQTMDELNYMMKDRQLASDLKCRVREYFHHSRHLQRSAKYSDLMAQMSPALRGEISLLRGVFSSVPPYSFFSSLSPELTVLIAQRVIHRLYTPNEQVAGVAMYVVQRGLAARRGRVLTSGAMWGDDFILNALHLIDTASTVALTYLETVILTRSIFDPLINSFPRDVKKLRRAVVKLTVIRGIPRIAAMIRARQTSPSNVLRGKRRKSSEKFKTISLGGTKFSSSLRLTRTTSGDQFKPEYIFDELLPEPPVSKENVDGKNVNDKLFQVCMDQDSCYQVRRPEDLPNPDLMRIENALRSVIDMVTVLQVSQERIMTIWGIASNQETPPEVDTGRMEEYEQGICAEEVMVRSPSISNPRGSGRPAS